MYVERANFCIISAHVGEKKLEILFVWFFLPAHVWKTWQITFLVLNTLRGQQAEGLLGCLAQASKGRRTL